MGTSTSTSVIPGGWFQEPSNWHHVNNADGSSIFLQPFIDGREIWEELLDTEAQDRTSPLGDIQSCCPQRIPQHQSTSMSARHARVAHTISSLISLIQGGPLAMPSTVMTDSGSRTPKLIILEPTNSTFPKLAVLSL